MNLAATTPILIVAAAATLALGVGLVPGRAAERYGPTAVAIIGLVAAAVMSLVFWGDRIEAFEGSLHIDRFSMLLNLIFITAALAVIILSIREPGAVARRGEYASLILFSTAGMMLVGAAGDLIVLFVGIEILSVSLYVLAALEVWRERSLEAGLKYLIMGAIGSSILLYGFALLYGATGTTRLGEIADALNGSALGGEPLVLGAVVLMVAGLGFKASAAPFHMWTPDVYEGAPTPITAFMSTATKAAALAAFLRIFTAGLADIEADWDLIIGVVAAAAIIVGNVAALLQDNMKRLLAYSSVGQAGYLLIGVAAGSIQGAEATLYYLLVYLAMTLAAFAIVIIREREVIDGDTVQALAGYARRRPVHGAVLTLAMLSLAGFPPLSGFLGKFLLFGSAVEADMIWLAVIGALGSIVSLGYYLRVLGVAWLGDRRPSPAERGLESPPLAGLVTVTSGLAIVALTIAASPVLDACRSAAESLLA
ncbi:MAG: NADH-quinone oxidoreductase subunit N, partial [Thermoleophilia bacterium]|nr:NADH-quinone oxidoreductase subunit N [Thermoleophilia bacterium]